MHGHGYQGPLGGARGPGDDQHRDADGRQWQAPKQAVIVAESDRGPWINSTRWGQNFPVSIPPVQTPIAGEPVLVSGGVQIFDNDSITPGPPRRMNVILSRAAFQPVGSKVMCWAKMRIGVGAINHTFACDWPETGLVFSAPMSSLVVSAVFASQLAGGTYNPDLTVYPFGVQLTRGGGAVQTTLHLTAQMQPLSPGNNATFQVPRFAKRVILIPDRTGFFAADTAAQFQGGTALLGFAAGTQLSPTAYLPVPNFCSSLIVSAATFNGNVQALWEIEI